MPAAISAWCTVAVAQQSWNQRVLAVNCPVGEDQQAGAVLNRLHRWRRSRSTAASSPAAPSAQSYVSVQSGLPEGRRPCQDRWSAAARAGRPHAGWSAPDWTTPAAARVSGPRPKMLARRPCKLRQRHHLRLAQRVDRRIGYLAKQLVEVMEQRPRQVGKHSHRRVDRPWSRWPSTPLLPHGTKQHHQLLAVVTKSDCGALR